MTTLNIILRDDRTKSRGEQMSIWLAIPIGVAIIAVLIAAVRRGSTSNVTDLHLHR
jgi:hypothetical protein